LIDIDESSVVLATANRTYGHAPIGHRPCVVVPPPHGAKYTLILAVSPVFGVVNALVTKENTNTDVYERFLKKYLIFNIGQGK
jgi:mRNA-degrading endonuclease toxin of MazEF toxin-antitoxin module